MGIPCEVQGIKNLKSRAQGKGSECIVSSGGAVFDHWYHEILVVAGCREKNYVIRLVGSLRIADPS